MKDRIIRGDSVLHYSFQAISSNYILFLLFPYTCFWKEEAEQETSNQFSRMLCNTGSDWEGKKHYLELSQEIWHQESVKLWKSTEDWQGRENFAEPSGIKQNQMHPIERSWQKQLQF